MEIKFLFEIIVVIASVIGLFLSGIFIGKEFGAFENFIQALLSKIEKIFK